MQFGTQGRDKGLPVEAIGRTVSALRYPRPLERNARGNVEDDVRYCIAVRYAEEPSDSVDAEGGVQRNGAVKEFGGINRVRFRTNLREDGRAIGNLIALRIREHVASGNEVIDLDCHRAIVVEYGGNVSADTLRERIAAIRARMHASATPAQESTMAIGTVKFFNTQKGFGFIQPDDGGKDVFVHISAVERAGMGSLAEGQKVKYDVAMDRGKSAATNLSAV